MPAAGKAPAPRAPRKAANGKAPKRAMANAVAELNGSGEPRTASFNGVEIKIPPQLPQTFMMDYAELQEMQIAERPESIGMAAMLVKSVIGEGQWRAIRNSMVGELSKDGGAAVLGELVSTILSGMDMDPGESPASGTS